MKPILNECPHKMEVLKSVDREESCLFIFIMLSVIMQMLSSLLFTVPTSQSTEINLHFLCFAHQRISSALATVWLVGKSMYKISVKIPVWQPGQIYELVKTKWPPGRRCRTTRPLPVCHCLVVNISPLPAWLPGQRNAFKIICSLYILQRQINQIQLSAAA